MRPVLRLAALLALLAAPAHPATLEVSVRVVDRCTVEVPPAVPPGLEWVAGGPHPVAHACAGNTPAAVHAAPHTPVAGGSGPPGLGGEGPPGRAAGGPPGQAKAPQVLVTVTY